MKKLLLIAILIFALSLSVLIFLFAQKMMAFSNNTSTQSDDGHTAREEAEGKEIWNKFQSGELKCEDLSDENFGVLGEYFMGQMTGDSHKAMNNMMIAVLGEEDEEEMHVAMGKRMSNCEPNTAMSQNIINGGMMQMMSNWSNSSILNNNFANPMSMMNFGFAPFGWVFMIFFWALLIIGIVVLTKWILSQNKIESEKDKTALDILKERYAKGDINKKEFQEKKKDLE
jgi:putative membrane protein